MIISHKSKVEKSLHIDSNVKNKSVRVLISPKEGWEGYVMRIWELGKDGHSAKHLHDWPHIVYVLEGKGKLNMDGIDYDLEPGSYAFIPANVLHQFINKNEEPLEFICIVPEEGHEH
ncbi:MAG: cupin domain-containing protein [Clostridiales bacterium]|nr:cupin domain-containing protein [Clostridiales bacterium]